MVILSGGPHTGQAQRIYNQGYPIQNDSSIYPIGYEFLVDASM